MGYWKIVCRNFTYSFSGERAGDKDFYLRLVSRKLVNMHAGNLNFDSDFRNEIYDPSILRLEGRRMVKSQEAQREFSTFETPNQFSTKLQYLYL